MRSNVTIKNVSWPHFSWPTLYMFRYRNTSGPPPEDDPIIMSRVCHTIMPLVGGIRWRFVSYWSTSEIENENVFQFLLRVCNNFGHLSYLTVSNQFPLK